MIVNGNLENKGHEQTKYARRPKCTSTNYKTTGVGFRQRTEMHDNSCTYPTGSTCSKVFAFMRKRKNINGQIYV